MSKVSALQAFTPSPLLQPQPNLRNKMMIMIWWHSLTGVSFEVLFNTYLHTFFLVVFISQIPGQRLVQMPEMAYRDWNLYYWDEDSTDTACGPAGTLKRTAAWALNLMRLEIIEYMGFGMCNIIKGSSWLIKVIIHILKIYTLFMEVNISNYIIHPNKSYLL